LWRAPRAGTVGLRSPDACDPLRESGDKVFGERFCATTDFITDVDEFFPDDDFFPDISSLYDDIGDNTGNANGSSSTVPYVLLILLVEIMMQFLALVSCLELFLSYSLIDVVTSLFILFLVVIYLFSILVISCAKLLIYPTDCCKKDHLTLSYAFSKSI
jgi:hypothetical protein